MFQDNKKQKAGGLQNERIFDSIRYCIADIACIACRNVFSGQKVAEKAGRAAGGHGCGSAADEFVYYRYEDDEDYRGQSSQSGA